MTIGEMFSAEDQRFWSLYAHYGLELLKRANKDRVALRKVAQVPSAIEEYVTCAVREMRKCLYGKTPYLRRRALNSAAKRFNRRQGWRGDIPNLAKNYENALRALAAEQVPGTAGNPTRTLGSSRIRERGYVNRAYHDLIHLALSQHRGDWLAELFTPARLGEKASPGRKLIFRYAIKLAQNDGVTLCPTTLREQIRERAKPARANFLALYARKICKSVTDKAACD
jgi:hypothetical protein